MNNPWAAIGAQSIHPDDEHYVSLHNRVVGKRHPEQSVRFYLPPQPYLGDLRTARVVLLGKNAIFSEQDEQDAIRLPAIEDENRKAMTFESDCPFFYLDPRFDSTEAYRWWWNVLEAVLNATTARGVERDTTLSRMAYAQYHPYRSEESFVPKEPFPTQTFTFQLVREAAQNPNTLFVMLYGAANERRWREAVPELPQSCLRLKSAQAAKLSPGNVPAADWERLISLLCAE